MLTVDLDLVRLQHVDGRLVEATLEEILVVVADSPYQNYFLLEQSLDRIARVGWVLY